MSDYTRIMFVFDCVRIITAAGRLHFLCCTRGHTLVAEEIVYHGNLRCCSSNGDHR